jgi:hypothetical protein
LDSRFGAGRLNIYNSYKIIDSGEQDSAEDGVGTVGTEGFHYDASFGTGGNNATGTYTFQANPFNLRLCASLVWTLEIASGNNSRFYGDATLHNMDLVLFDVTEGSQVAASTGSGDNTESLSWVPLVSGHDYELSVQSIGNFEWDYALAWRMVPVDQNDQDYDGFPDDLEARYGLSSSDPDDAALDSDSDGLPNLEEYYRNTVMTVPDTDGDGIDDGPEFYFWAESCSDPDGDGLHNLIDPDSDNDGMDDGPERDYWTNRDCSAIDGCSGNCLNCDIDGDGKDQNMLDPDADSDTFLDGVEVQYGTDPADDQSKPEIPAVPATTPYGLFASVLLLLVGGAWMVGGRKRQPTSR